MSWGPKEWIEWGNTVKAFFSVRGAVLSKYVLSRDQEGEFFMAAITDPDKYPEIDGLKDTLLGVPIMFTSKLPRNRRLFLVETR